MIKREFILEWHWSFYSRVFLGACFFFLLQSNSQKAFAGTPQENQKKAASKKKAKKPTSMRMGQNHPKKNVKLLTISPSIFSKRSLTYPPFVQKLTYRRKPFVKVRYSFPNALPQKLLRLFRKKLNKCVKGKNFGKHSGRRISALLSIGFRRGRLRILKVEQNKNFPKSVIRCLRFRLRKIHGHSKSKKIWSTKIAFFS